MHASNPSPHRLGATSYDQNKILNTLRRTEQGLRARLLSIYHDTYVALDIYQLLFPHVHIPIFANARAGSWYVPPIVRAKPTYTSAFKSADGHYGQWSSSLRRPNMNVLQAAIDSGAVVIVDVTRRGKRFPDSLMKTVPIWCAVINNIARLRSCKLCHHLQTTCPQCSIVHLHPVVPQSERQQIHDRLPEWLADWRRSMHILQGGVPTIKNAITRLSKPLRPIWVSPNSNLWAHGIPLNELDFTPVVCISASKTVPNGERSYIEPSLSERQICGITFPPCPVGFPYVQGAGDDEEAWSRRLSPQHFWNNHDRLLPIAHALNEHVTAIEIEQRLQNEISAILSETHIGNGGSLSCDAPSHLSTTGRRIWHSGIRLRRVCVGELSQLVRSEMLRVGFIIVLGADVPQDLIEMERKESEDGSKIAKLSDRVEWMPLTNYKGKVDYKYGFGRALGRCLSRLRQHCVDRDQDVLICSTDKKGDWCAGLAIAWLAWHCETTETEGDEEIFTSADEKGYTVIRQRKDSIGCVEKEKVRSTMLQFMCRFPDFEISRATLKQINRFFTSSAPSSTLCESL